MLVDIFARRYESLPLRDAFEQRDSRLLVQAFRILSEDLFPYYSAGNEYEPNVAIWKSLQARLSRELGLQELSPEWISWMRKVNGNDVPQTLRYPMVTVCKNWFEQAVVASPDTHIKERLSLIELGFRERAEQIAAMNAVPIVLTAQSLDPSRGIRLPGDWANGEQTRRAQRTQAFQSSINELNERFRQAGYPLHYHNGFIQFSTDELLQKQVETPFWAIAADPIWKNVDHDMKEALDLRDSNGRDPAFYAARALESAIKIVSDRKGWTHGKEKGASNYIDNLASKKNAFLEQWEGKVLRDFFSDVRNPLGHGAGSAQMPSLSREQTEWAIEFCMSWIKNLARRL